MKIKTEGGEKNMINKIASLAGAGMLLLGVSAPAFAYHSGLVRVYNSARSYANTGDNTQGHAMVVDHSGVGSVDGGGNNDMKTGDAEANSTANTTVNTTLNGWVDAYSLVSVKNKAYSDANTGYNIQGNTAIIDHSGVGEVKLGGDNTMDTGDATANSSANTTVNLTVNGVWEL